MPDVPISITVTLPVSPLITESVKTGAGRDGAIRALGELVYEEVERFVREWPESRSIEPANEEAEH